MLAYVHHTHYLAVQMTADVAKPSPSLSTIQNQSHKLVLAESMPKVTDMLRLKLPTGDLSGW